MALTDGDRLMQRYLRDRELPGADDHEPDLGVSRRPDFFIPRAGVSLVAEVKTLTKSPILERTKVAGFGRAFSMGADELHRPIRSAVKEASRQLRPLRDHGHALVVVIANPHRLPFDHSLGMVLGALYGNEAVVMPFDSATGTLDEDAASAQFTRNGKLTNDHPYISGVVLLDADPDGVPTARAFETVSAAVLGTAVRLPLEVFDGARDQRYSWDRDGDQAVVVER